LKIIKLIQKSEIFLSNFTIPKVIDSSSNNDSIAEFIFKDLVDKPNEKDADNQEEALID
jgi:hypothetical protein